MSDIDKKIGTLQKRMNWHVDANDASKVFELVDQIHKLEVQRIAELPEPYKTDLMDNLEFQKFALYHITDPFIKAASEMADDLSNLLFRMVVIEQDGINQANNVLQQYFYEQLLDGLDRDPKSWREDDINPKDQ